jgi:hypothetical protein
MRSAAYPKRLYGHGEVPHSPPLSSWSSRKVLAGIRNSLRGCMMESAGGHGALKDVRRGGKTGTKVRWCIGPALHGASWPLAIAWIKERSSTFPYTRISSRPPV